MLQTILFVVCQRPPRPAFWVDFVPDLFNFPGLSHTHPRHFSPRQREDPLVEIIVNRFRALLKDVFVCRHDVMQALSVVSAVTNELVVLSDFCLGDIDPFATLMKQVLISLFRRNGQIKEFALPAILQIRTPVADKGRTVQLCADLFLILIAILPTLDELALTAATRTIPRRDLAKTPLVTDQPAITEVFLVFLILLILSSMLSKLPRDRGMSSFQFVGYRQRRKTCIQQIRDHVAILFRQMGHPTPPLFEFVILNAQPPRGLLHPDTILHGYPMCVRENAQPFLCKIKRSLPSL